MPPGSARHQLDAVGLELVERVGDLGEGTVDVRQRHRGEMPEPRRMSRAELGGMLVDRAREPPRLVGADVMQPGRREREHRRGDAVLVHLLEAARNGPVAHHRALAHLAHDREILGRIEMMMHVDTASVMGIGHGFLYLRLVMLRESGASSKHRPWFYLKERWLLDRPLARGVTTGGDSALPKFLAPPPPPPARPRELRPHEGGMPTRVERALREAAVGAAHHVFAAEHAGEPPDPLGHEFRMLDDVGRVADHARARA